MRECWPEGDLRAYLDWELPAEDQDRLAAHLETCAECRDRYAEVARRAARVSSLMDVLPEPAEDAVALAGGGSRSPARGRWASAALALAAALAFTVVMLPKPGKQPAQAVAPPVGPRPAEPAPAVVRPAVIRGPVVRRARMHSPVSHADYYVSLDNEPIETARVVRVSLEDSDVQADLIVGPDGLAHAIRLVSIK
ncbi:MAG TPA: zf-HC2 domain-containing protein [Bryobacteraceae bacterium]|nr:zf-HC2 domain-containing protein [Bryobacteraceae bacterium]